MYKTILSSFSLLLTMGVVVSVAVSVLLFLPALIELRKPRDAGPRLIADAGSFAFSKSLNAISPNFESETAQLQKSQNKLSDLLDENDDAFT